MPDIAFIRGEIERIDAPGPKRSSGLPSLCESDSEEFAVIHR